MCPMADMYELRDCSQKGNIKKKTSENLLKEDSTDTTENVFRDKEYIFEISRDLEEIETIPAKITNLQSKKESIILPDEDLRKSWYFTHV
jgi:hypothetical protein